MPFAKLTESDIQDARRLQQEGCSLRKIARIKGVNHAQISRALSGKGWKHVTPYPVQQVLHAP